MEQQQPTNWRIIAVVAALALLYINRDGCNSPSVDPDSPTGLANRIVTIEDQSIQPDQTFVLLDLREAMEANDAIDYRRLNVGDTDTTGKDVTAALLTGNPKLPHWWILQDDKVLAHGPVTTLGEITGKLGEFE